MRAPAKRVRPPQTAKFFSVLAHACFNIELLHRVEAEPILDTSVVFKEVIDRVSMFAHHQVAREPLSVRERMSTILVALREGQFLEFSALFRYDEGKMGAVVTFLAILELCKESLIEVVQAESFAPIHIRAATAASAGEEPAAEGMEQQ